MIKELDFFIEQLISWTIYEHEGEPSQAFKTAYPYIYRRFEFFATTQVKFSENALSELKLITNDSINLKKCNWYTRIRISATRKYDYLHKYLVWEHKTTGYEFKIKLHELYEQSKLNHENICQLLNIQEMAWITKAENNELNRLGYSKKRPNPDEAYRRAQIRLL